VRRHAVSVNVHRGSLFHPLPERLHGRISSVVAHLPSVWLGGIDEYAPEEIRAPRETYEGPGGDGLDLHRALLLQAPTWLAREGRIVISMESWQWQVLRDEISSLGYREISVLSPSESGRVIVLGRTIAAV
jgi:release factor glutamine methyltransferase